MKSGKNIKVTPVESDDEGYWRDFKESGRLAKKERESINSDAIKKWCTENSFEYQVVQDYQIRIYSKEKTIDIFPQSKKYHNIKENLRGTIKSKITAFLTDFFINKNK